MTVMTNTAINTIVFWLIAQVAIGQGISFVDTDWDGVLHQATKAKKPVFIDMYTTWCAPCLTMDKTTFADREVGAYFNEEFISLKVNAEDNGKGSFIAKKFNVGVYPTLLFISSTGELITRTIGMQSKHDLLEKGKITLNIYDNLDYLTSVKNNIETTYNKTELEKILKLSRHHSFSGKNKHAMNYLDMIATISEDDLKLVMDEVKSFDPIHLRRVALLTMSVPYREMKVRRNAKEWIKWKNDTEFSIYHFIKTATEGGSFSTLEQSIEILKDLHLVNPRQVDQFYLKYYRRNNMDQYKTFASYMIHEHIIPTHHESVAAADREKYKRLNEEVQKSLVRLAGDNVSIEEEEISKTPTLDAFAKIYTISKSIADELFEISSDFSAFYEDEGSKRKAIFWASLAYKFYPYDFKYYDNHIYILKSNGKEKEALEVENNMKSLPYYNELKIAASTSW